MKQRLITGNVAVAEGAIRSGCKAFFGYPITPQNEIPAYMAEHLPLQGGVFLQAESEVSAINMVYGAAGAGVRVMTSSSGPGISLKQEGISYIAGAQLPCVIVNVVRSGPGLGGIYPSQGDYFQATKGGGHGDYHLIVLAPSSVQEMADLTMLAFELADKWRNPVMILADGVLGQMMEPVRFLEPSNTDVDKPWATTGAKNRRPNIINSRDPLPESLERKVLALLDKYEKIKSEEIRWQETQTSDADVILVAYGISARIAQSAMVEARKMGYKVGLFRPISLFPFPETQLAMAAGNKKKLLVVEMSGGQMLEDVRLAAGAKERIFFTKRVGGMMPTPQQVVEKIGGILGKRKEPAISNERVILGTLVP